MLNRVKQGMLVLAALTALGGCSYAGVAATPDGKAIVAVNNSLFFGVLRKVYVCQVTPGGLTQCGAGENP